MFSVSGLLLSKGEHNLYVRHIHIKQTTYRTPPSLAIIWSHWHHALVIFCWLLLLSSYDTNVPITETMCVCVFFSSGSIDFRLLAFSPSAQHSFQKDSPYSRPFPSSPFPHLPSVGSYVLAFSLSRFHDKPSVFLCESISTYTIYIDFAWTISISAIAQQQYIILTTMAIPFQYTSCDDRRAWAYAWVRAVESNRTCCMVYLQSRTLLWLVSNGESLWKLFILCSMFMLFMPSECFKTNNGKFNAINHRRCIHCALLLNRLTIFAFGLLFMCVDVGVSIAYYMTGNINIWRDWDAIPSYIQQSVAFMQCTHCQMLEM